MPADLGDPTLGARLGDLLGDRHPVAAAATLGPRGVVVASRGAGLDADYEIGSVSKGVTGLLYADAVERGEVSPDGRLGEHLPLGACPSSLVTLASLSTHRSGLPSLPRAAAPLRRTLRLWTSGTNPYGDTLAELLDQVRTVRLGRPRVRYSNLGFQLLGHAVARAAGTRYADLVRDRLARPLGLAGLYAPSTPAELRPTALPGRSRRGRPRQAWTGEAVAPAGGLRAPVTAMARLTAALLAGDAPGSAALDPVARFSGRAARIGAAWITLRVGGREVTWHNGATGGFRSWLGMDREASTGVVLLSATSASLDRHGFRLLSDLTASG